MGALSTRQEDNLVELQKDFGREVKKFASVLPAHVTVERFLRVVVTALTMKPDLLQAPRDVILNECIRCAADGLIPDGKEAALVPRYGKEFSLAYQPMIAGIKKKVRNSGEVSTWDVVAVRANDSFEFGYGLEPYLRHSYDIRKARGETIAFYSVATLKDGTKSFDIMSVEDVNRIRDRSDAYKAFVNKKIRSTPWDSDYEEMGKKTVARRHSKDLPSSSDLDRLLYQGEPDRGAVDYGDITATATGGGRKSLAGRLDEIADENGETIDPETGEITGTMSEEERQAARANASDADGDDKAAAVGSGSDKAAKVDAPKQKGSEVDPEAALKEARRAGVADKKAGKPKRQMPAKYRNDERLSEAYVEGFDSAEVESGERN